MTDLLINNCLTLNAWQAARFLLFAEAASMPVMLLLNKADHMEFHMTQAYVAKVWNLACQACVSMMMASSFVRNPCETLTCSGLLRKCVVACVNSLPKMHPRMLRAAPIMACSNRSNERKQLHILYHVSQVHAYVFGLPHALSNSKKVSVGEQAVNADPVMLMHPSDLTTARGPESCWLHTLKQSVMCSIGIPRAVQSALQQVRAWHG